MEDKVKWILACIGSAVVSGAVVGGVVWTMKKEKEELPISLQNEEYKQTYFISATVSLWLGYGCGMGWGTNEDILMENVNIDNISARETERERSRNMLYYQGVDITRDFALFKDGVDNFANTNNLWNGVDEDTRNRHTRYLFNKIQSIKRKQYQSI